MKRAPVQAHSFQLADCSDPKCGPHIIAMDENDQPICEIIIPLRSMRELIKGLQAILYAKVVEND